MRLSRLHGLVWKDERGTWRVFSAEWYHLHRWAFWLFILATRRPRASMDFSYMTDTGAIRHARCPTYLES